MCIKRRSESEKLFPQSPRALDGGCLASFPAGLAVEEEQQGRALATLGWPVHSYQPAEACASCLDVGGMETANSDFLSLSLNLKHFVRRVASYFVAGVLLSLSVKELVHQVLLEPRETQHRGSKNSPNSCSS